MINEKRLLDTFLEYVQIDSETKNEKAMGERLVQDLKALGFEVLPSSANFILTKPVVPTEGLFNYLESKKIYVRYFPKVERIKDYLRISIGSQEEMEKVVMVIQEVLG